LVVLVKAPDVALPKVAGPLLVGAPVDELVFGRADGRKHRARVKIALVDVELFEGLLHRRDLVRRVKDEEMALVTDAVSVAAQNLNACGVKGADPQRVGDRP